MYPNHVQDHIEHCRRGAQEAAKIHAEWLKGCQDKRAQELAEAQARKDTERAREHQRQMQQDQYAHQRQQQIRQQEHELRMREMELWAMRNNGGR